MRYMMRLLAIAALAVPLAAQMTVDQRVHEFQALAGLYAKRYGPANWKIQALGVNIFELKPWMDRVRAAKNDLDYFEICAEFVASLRDGHSRFAMQSSFSADLGIFTDLYEGKVLVESVNRVRYPLNQFPFQVGDEVVSIDGRPVETILEELLRQRGYGTLGGARRVVADGLGFRAQSVYPRAVDLPDETAVAIRRAESGQVETYQLTWLKSGTPIRNSPPIPSPSFAAQKKAATGTPDYMELLNQMRNWSFDGPELAAMRDRVHIDENGESKTREFILGWGARNPYYTPPAGFVTRRGTAAADNFFSGTFTASGKRIGLIRIPHFGPANSLAAVRELEGEVAFFKANTDGLILDITRNTGGGCVGIDYMQRLVGREFYTFGEHLRPTLSLISSFTNALRAAQVQRADQWVIAVFEARLNELLESAKENRSMTGVLPACPALVTNSYPIPSLYEQPARNADGSVAAYDKPLIVLVDELSISFGDIFPGMMQDARRGPIVGMRTAGAGGSVSGWTVGTYSEGVGFVTNSLVVRAQPVKAPGLPAAPFIENVGVIPDIELNYMTRENLLTRGRPYMEAVTSIMLAEIAKN